MIDEREVFWNDGQTVYDSKMGRDEVLRRLGFKRLYPVRRTDGGFVVLFNRPLRKTRAALRWFRDRWLWLKWFSL
jgi:hypothetical protein